MQHAALRQRLHERDLRVHVAHILVLADQVVTAGYPRERIVDANDMPDLARRVLDAVPATAACAATHEELVRFLDDVFELGIDAGRHIGWLDSAVTHLSEGLATRVPRIISPNGVFRIEATAGSGKTQLALRLLKETAAGDPPAQYVCFNRPLADHMREIGPSAAAYAIFHELAIARLRAYGGTVDFADPTLFTRAAARYAESAGDPQWSLLVIDEAQDFDGEWIDGLRRHVVAGGRIYVMGDADQQMRTTTATPCAGADEGFYPWRCRRPFRSRFRYKITPNPARFASPITTINAVQYSPMRGPLIAQE